MKKPKVSVIIPAYNHEKYIGSAIQSLHNQSFQDFEIVIVDDCSIDKTLQVAKSYKDSRTRIYANKKNRGASLTMNRCIALAKGKYISVLNSDDMHHSDKLKIQVELLKKNPEVAAVFCPGELIGEHGENLHKMVFKNASYDRYVLLRKFFYDGNTLCHPSILIRKKIYKKIGYLDPRYTQLPDFDLWVRLLMKYKIGGIEKPLVSFRRRSGLKNASSMKPANNIRTYIEYHHILAHYLSITSLNEICRIFPEIKKSKKKLVTSLIPYYVARIALQSTFKSHHAFGIHTIFNLLKDRRATYLLGKYENFGYPDAVNLFGSYDIFDTSTREKQQYQIEKRTYEKIVNSKFYHLWQWYCKLKKLAS